MKTKLTLRLEEDLIQEAKHQAQRRGTSVSQMVADYFALLSQQPTSKEDKTEHTEFTKSLMGVAAGVDIGTGPKDHRDAYYKGLEEKHQ